MSLIGTQYTAHAGLLIIRQLRQYVATSNNRSDSIYVV